MSSTGAGHPVAPVSVIIATNRASPFLGEALDSVARQSTAPLEVIVVDDGSLDPDEIARSTAGRRGVTVLRREAAGVSTARNAGAAIARGTVLAFLDDDDRWHPERLERQLASLAAMPEAVAGYCGMQSIDEQGAVIAPADQTAVTDRADIARREAGIILPNLLVLRSAFEAVGGFRGDLRLAEDLDLVFRLSKQGAFAFTPDVLVDYRAHPGNTTRRYRPLVLGIDEVVRSHLATARQEQDAALVAAHRDSLRSNRRFAWWAALRSARAHLRDRRPGTAVSDLAWAIRFAPAAPVDAVRRRIRRR